MSRHPIDVLKAALTEAKTEAATLRIKTATLAQERNVVIEERNKARARVKELEQQNAVQRENVDEAMRENTPLHTVAAHRKCKPAECKVALLWHEWSNVTDALTECGYSDTAAREAAVACVERFDKWNAATSDKPPFRQPVGGPKQDTLARIRELEAEVQRLQQDRAQVGAFGFKPLGIR